MPASLPQNPRGLLLGVLHRLVVYAELSDR